MYVRRTSDRILEGLSSGELCPRVEQLFIRMEARPDLSLLIRTLLSRFASSHAFGVRVKFDMYVAQESVVAEFTSEMGEYLTRGRLIICP